jgi:peptidoglycan hydrolase-like protein with peptidoglycan-binding domain
MDMVGERRRLENKDYAELAKSINVTEAHLRTVIEVETSGKGFDGAGWPLFLFETHRFYKELGAGVKRNKAVREGLAKPNWGGPGSYPKTPELRRKQFLKACELDETKAIRSTSWGLGQIMGDEYDEAGYESPQAMLEAFKDSERNQVEGMVKLIKHRNLDDALRKQDWHRFALRYNGAGYKKNKYHTKLADAYSRWSLKLRNQPEETEESGVLQVGSKGARVAALQALLVEKGYHVKIDEEFGPATRDAVLSWQANNDRPLDGSMDTLDIDLLEKSDKKPISAERATTTAAELKPESGIIQKTDLGTKVTAGGVIGGTVIKTLDATGVLDDAPNKIEAAGDKIEKVGGAVEKVKDAVHATGLDTFLTFISQNMIWVAGALAIFVLYLMYKIQRDRVRMHQKGEAV